MVAQMVQNSVFLTTYVQSYSIYFQSYFTYIQSHLICIQSDLICIQSHLIYIKSSYLYSVVFFAFSHILFVFSHLIYIQSSYIFSDTLFMFSFIVFVFSLILFVFGQILYAFSLIFYVFIQLFSETATKEGDPTQVFSCEYYEIFNNTYFEEHLRTAGVLKQHVISKFFWFPNIAELFLEIWQHFFNGDDTSKRIPGRLFTLENGVHLLQREK